MGGILELLGLILKITILGFGTFIVLHVLRSMKKKTLREEISKIEAKMSAFRLNLKSRVAKKSRHFRATYPSNIMQGEPIDIALNHLSSLSFEKNSDFQDYIDLCKQINKYIDLANIDRSSDAAQNIANNNDQHDFMGTDFKNELSIVRLINDMVIVSTALAKQMNRFNNFDRRAKILVPEPVNFASLFELQKVFRNKETHDANFDKNHNELEKSA